MRFECRITEATDAHSEYVILLSRGNGGYANASHCYVTRTLPPLLILHQLVLSAQLSGRFPYSFPEYRGRPCAPKIVFYFSLQTLHDERGDGTRSHISRSESYRVLLRTSDTRCIAAFSGYVG